MVNHKSFHCKIDISRNLPNNISTTDTLHNTLNFFFHTTPTPFVSVGSAKKSSIVAHGLSEKHCMFNFQDDSIVIKAFDTIKIKSSTEEKTLHCGDVVILTFTQEKLVESHTLLEWIIEIRPHVIIHIVVTSEEGLAKEGLEHYLSEKYEFAKKISESESYLIYQVTDNSVVKILHPYLNQEQLQVMEFFRVAKNIAFLENEIFCKIHDFDEQLPHARVEKIEGETLQNYLAKKGKLSYSESILVLKKLLILLETTHRAKYICKNLHLDNILCGRDQKIKFTGWNTALYGISLNSKNALYLAPEYIREDKASFSADIYSLGVILYRLITGKFPFSGSKEYQQRVLNDQPITDIELQKGSVYITPQTAKVLEKMLSFYPENRSNINAVKNWLKKANDFKLWESVLNMEEQQVFYGIQIVTSPQPIQGEILPLKNNTEVTIGRQADVNIPGDKHISRKHTKLHLKNGDCVLEDLGSSNGTQVMGEKIQKCQIDSGVSFKIGQTTLAFWNYEELRKEREGLIAPTNFDIQGWHSLTDLVQKNMFPEI